MLTDAQVKQVQNNLWNGFINNVSDNELSNSSYCKTTAMVLEFEDYVRNMDLLNMYNEIETMDIKDYDSETFDEYDLRLIKSRVSESTDIWFKLNNRSKYGQ
jgi:hypothetical protein